MQGAAATACIVARSLRQTLHYAMQLQITRVAGGSAPGVASLQRAARPQRAAAAPSRQRAVAVKAGLLDFFNQVGRRRSGGGTAGGCRR